MNQSLHLIEKEQKYRALIPEWIRAERIERISSSAELNRIANSVPRLPRHRRTGK